MRGMEAVVGEGGGKDEGGGLERVIERGKGREKRFYLGGQLKPNFDLYVFEE